MKEEGRRKVGSLQALREHSPGWPGSQAFLQKGPQQMEHNTHIPGKGVEEDEKVGQRRGKEERWGGRRRDTEKVKTEKMGGLRI